MPDSNGDIVFIDVLSPTNFLEDRFSTNGFVALIVLNSPLDDIEYFQRLYGHADFRICADGGANRLHDLMVKQTSKLGRAPALTMALPDAIHGDLDSLNDTVRSRYSKYGVEISCDPDQYSTDFEKSVKKVFTRLPRVQDVLVLGSIGGRVDQGIGLLGELYREQKTSHPTARFWLFSESSVSTILSPGTTLIHTPLSGGLITRNVGILSVYGPAKISTEGLEFDVQDWPTEMGGQMSTSNHIVSDSIKISTDNHVLFTVERALRHERE